MSAASKRVKKHKPDPKQAFANPAESHPAGLWVDSNLMARLRTTNQAEKKQLFEASQRYLELASLALDEKKDEKKKEPHKK
ncbi:MAG TPA: hypothetical protein VFZ99_05050 [Terriglobales bacterium]